jgi:RHS repeat-associated protein
MKSTLRAMLVLSLLSISGSVASAQVTVGTPPFASFGGGPDVINLANLNVHLAVPVLSKSGRGMGFSYDLSYDGSVWYPAISGGSQSWRPYTATQWGWTTSVPRGGRVTYQESFFEKSYGNCVLATTTYSNWVYVDGLGTPHGFTGSSEVETGCANVKTSFNSTAWDGSGYTLSVTGSTINSLIASDGTIINPATGATTLQDRNGNQITSSTSSGTTSYYDTLSSTTAVLAVAGSGTPSSPLTFTYSAPSGANAPYTMKFTSQTVRTNFGCSGVSEYGPTAQNLVSEIDLPDGTKYLFTYESTPGYSGDVTGRLASVTLPTGGTISYFYSGGSNGITCADGSAATLTRSTPDTGSNYWTYAHSESGSAWTTTITDPQGNQKVIDFQGIYRTETQTYQGSTAGTLLKTTYICYNGSAVPCNSTAIGLPISQLAHVVQWPGTSGLQSKNVKFYNSYGLLTEKDEYSYGTSGPGSLVRKTLTAYASLSNGIVSMPSSVTVEDSSGNIKSRSTYCYDEGTPSGTTTCNAAGSPTATSGTPQHVAITGSRGNLTTSTSLVSGSTTLGKTVTYYDTGNVNVATDINGASSTFTYGSGSCGNTFVTTVSEPLSLSESMTWNCTGGVGTSLTDENGKTVSITYNDPYFWRTNSTTDPLSNVTSFAYASPTSVERSMTFGSSTADVLITEDTLGRTHISQTKESPSSSTYDSIEVDYDSDGRADRNSLPYAGTAGQTNSSAPGKNTSYDELGRKTQITDSGGRSITYSYQQNDAYRTAGPAPTGENTKRRQFEYDALGRLTSVCEITSATGSGTCGQTSPATGYWTEYTYDLNNNLIGVTQNAQSSTTQSRAYGYDDLGRMTSETNPETENSAVTYTYDTDATCGTSKGDLVKKVDVVGNTICYSYDALHRLTSVTYPSGSYAAVTPSRLIVYDSATVNSIVMANAKTRMAEVYTCYSPCTTKLTDSGFSYTARGEVSDLYESTPHSGGYYHVNETYWANGALNGLSGLSALPTITYTVDGEGRISSATASSGQNPLSSTTYNVASLPIAVDLGSSDSDSFAYDPNTDRMTQYSFNVNGQSVVGNLTWNPLGTLGSLVISDPFNSADAQTCSYSHDDLMRIASANCGSIWSQTFSYDAFGNLSKNGTSSFLPIYSSSTNQMTSIGSSTPTYDSNGNVTNDFLNSYAWDSNGRPVTVDSVGVTYDALGRPVEQNLGGAYTEVVYAPAGGKLALMSGSTLKKGFVALTNGASVIYGPSGLAYYRHSDWIGSSRFASTPTRALYYDGAYGPFGEPYAQTGTNDPSFTGQNQDTASNVYDFPAREYGIQGRWASPDPAGASSVHLKDPQTWNRYAYVRNSPLKLVDSTGTDENGTDNPGEDPGEGGGDSGIDGGGDGSGDNGGGVDNGNGDNGSGDDGSGDDGNGDNGNANGDGQGVDNNSCDTACQDQEIDDAIAQATDALNSNPDCAQAVDGNSGVASATLTANPFAIGLNTTMGSNDLGATGPLATAYWYYPLPGPPNPWTTQSTITFNSNATNGFFNGSVPNYDTYMSQAIVLLHELAHIAGAVGFPSAVLPDATNIPGPLGGNQMSLNNSQTIADACFPEGDGGDNPGPADDPSNQPVDAARGIRGHRRVTR